MHAAKHPQMSVAAAIALWALLCIPAHAAELITFFNPAPAASGLTLQSTDSAHTTAQSAYLETVSIAPAGASGKLIVLAVSPGTNAAPACTYAGSETFTQGAAAAFASNVWTYIYYLVPSAGSGVIRVTPSASTEVVLTWYCFSGAQATPGAAATDYVTGGMTLTRSLTTGTAASIVVTACTLGTDAISGDAVTNGSQANYHKETSTSYLVANLLTSTLLTTTAGSYTTGFAWTESSNGNIAALEIRPAP